MTPGFKLCYINCFILVYCGTIVWAYAWFTVEMLYVVCAWFTMEMLYQLVWAYARF